MKLDRIVIAIAIVLLAVYAVFLRRSLSFAVGGPDTSGYLNEARMIRAGRTTVPVVFAREFGLGDEWLHVFMPLGFAPSPRGSMHPTYPAGLPMHLALAAAIGGWKHAPYYVTPLAALGCAILMFVLCLQLGVSSLPSLAGSIALVMGPAFLWHAVQPASDVLATFWTLVAMCLVLATAPHPRFAHLLPASGEKGTRLAILAGVAFGISVWVRPTNLLLALPLAFAVRFRWRDLVAIAAGALPFGVALAMWNAKLYGSPLRTGYGGLLDQVSWGGLLHAGPQYIEWLAIMTTPIVFPGCLLIAFDRRIERWTRYTLLVWIGVFLLFYSFYGFFDGYLCLRFVLPAIPAMIASALLLLQRLQVRGVKMVIATVLIVAIVVTPIVSSKKTKIIPFLPHIEKGYVRVIRWAEPQLPKRAIVITGVYSGAFQYYADRPIVRYDQLDDDRFQLLRAYAANSNRPWFAVLPADELDYTALQKRFRGQWTVVHKMEGVTLYRLD